MMRYLFLTALFLFCAPVLFAQCSIPTHPAVVTSSTGYAAAKSNTTYAAGSTYAWTASSGTLTNVNFQGGTLYIFGNVTLTNSSSSNVAGTNIVIMPGATLTIDKSIGSVNFNIGITITNYGTLIINMNFSQGSNVVIINDGSGVMTVNGDYTMNSGSTLVNVTKNNKVTVTGTTQLNGTVVNNGVMELKATTLNSSGSVCLGEGSHFNVNGDFMANKPLTVSPAGAKAEIAVSGNLTVNGSGVLVTGGSNVKLCYSKSSTNRTATQMGFGSSGVYLNCTYGTNLLPVVFATFRVQLDDNKALLQWVTGSETNLRDFVVEYSYDGKTFLPLTTVGANNRPSTYSYTAILDQRMWFRIKGEDEVGGGIYYSVVLLADYKLKGDEAATGVLRIQPNIISNGTLRLWCSYAVRESGNLMVLDMMGRVVFRQAITFEAGVSNVALFLNGVGVGMYILVYENAMGKKLLLRFSIVQ